MATRGFAVLDVGEGYARARELCERLGDRHHLLPTLWGLRTHHSVRGQPRVARELALELLSRAREEEHGPYTPLAHLGLGMTLHYLGDLADAREHLELGLSLSHGEGWHPNDLPTEQQNVRFAGLRYLACVLWALGHPDQALDRATAALDLARKSSDVASVIAFHIFLARVHQFRGDPERVREVAEVARALAREHGFAQRLAAATILWGWALAARGPERGGHRGDHRGHRGVPRHRSRRRRSLLAGPVGRGARHRRPGRRRPARHR